MEHLCIFLLFLGATSCLSFPNEDTNQWRVQSNSDDTNEWRNPFLAEARFAPLSKQARTFGVSDEPDNWRGQRSLFEKVPFLNRYFPRPIEASEEKTFKKVTPSGSGPRLNIFDEGEGEGGEYGVISCPTGKKCIPRLGR